MKLEDLEQAVGVRVAVLLAGFLGAVIQLALNPKISFLGAFASIVAGMACAVYLSPIFPPWILEWMALPAARAELAIAFFTGLLGMQFTARVYAWFGTLSIPDIFDWLADTFGKNRK